MVGDVPGGMAVSHVEDGRVKRQGVHDGRRAGTLNGGRGEGEVKGHVDCQTVVLLAIVFV